MPEGVGRPTNSKDKKIYKKYNMIRDPIARQKIKDNSKEYKNTRKSEKDRYVERLTSANVDKKLQREGPHMLLHDSINSPSTNDAIRLLRERERVKK